MDAHMTFNGPLQGQSLVVGMRVSGGTANIHFHHATDRTQNAPVRDLPFSRNEDIIIRPSIFSTHGLGKTQVALEFAYRRAENDVGCSIFWVHADTEAIFAQDFALIGRNAGLSALNGEGLLKAVLFGVGVAHGDSATQSIPKSFLVGSLRAIQVTSTLPQEAQSLLATVRDMALGNDEIDDTAALLSELHHIPLPVSQAAAYIRRTATPVKTYLSRLRDGKKRWALLNKINFDRYRREGVSNSILETWNITIQHLKEEDETAVKILYILMQSFEDNETDDDTDENVDADDNLDTNDADDAGDADEVTEDAVTRLREFSFFHMTVNPYSELMFDMHHLVQEATLYNHSVWGLRDSMRYPATAIRILTQLFPDRKRVNWGSYSTS
ncbi:hypothetical protein LZ31DRAFT_582946 [Colletotrichum somersetense]|nr:hypothetical protein LZ31DRAFT_582946 [Colletotrichum somersetense]